MTGLDQLETVELTRARLMRLRPDSRRVWGRMTAHQKVCHLADSFELPLGQRRSDRIALPLPPRLVKWLALQTPLKWSRNFPTAPAVEQGAGGTPPDDWERDMARLLRRYDEFCGNREDWAEHPFFGQMSVAEWMRWGYRHTDHHLRQFGE